MSRRNTDETAFHMLMPNLDESAAQNEIERILLKELQESYRIYENCQEIRSSLVCEIKSAKGDQLRCLKKSLHRTIELLNMEDRTIVALCNEPELRNLYEREKAKLLKYRRSNPISNKITIPWIKGTK